MKKEIFNSLPYVSRKELLDLREYMNSSFEDNAHLIYEENVDSALYQYKDYTGQYTFNIHFLQFEPQKNKNIYKVYFSPRSLSRIEGDSHNLNFDELKTAFIRWIGHVVKMHEITQDYYDPYKKFYDEQFANFFTNDDDDALINPFEIERQEILFYFLTYAEKTIVKSIDIADESKTELINDITELRQNLPNLNKKRFVSALSKFAQKSKKISNKLFHDIFDVLKKEIIKKVLYKGAEELPNIIHKIEGWIKLLN